VRLEPTQIAAPAATDVEDARIGCDALLEKLIDEVDIDTAQQVGNGHARIVGICRFVPQVCRLDTVSGQKPA